jgi:hypothetical protein
MSVLVREGSPIRGRWAVVTATILVACVAVGAAPTAGEDASAPPAGSVAVAGSILGICDVDAGTDTTVDGVREWRGWTVTCRETMSDPRVSGLNQHRYSRDCRYSLTPGDTDDVSPIGCVTWSDFVLTGADGTWVGNDRGFVTADGEVDTFRVATGRGAYDGWTYVSAADESHISGVLYQGPPPLWTPPASPTIPSPPPGSPNPTGA